MPSFSEMPSGLSIVQTGTYLFPAEFEKKGNMDQYTRYGDYYIIQRQTESASRNDTNGKGVERYAEFIQVKSGQRAHLVPVRSWQDQWLVYAIARVHRLPKQELPPELSRIQVNQRFTVEEIRRIGDVMIYRRMLGEEPWDYCVQYRNIVQHGLTPQAAIANWRADELKRKQSDEVTINQQFARQRGISVEEYAHFCADNNLNLEDSYTRKELRAYVVKNRKMNCMQYQSTLRQLGIPLNCK
ncbi:hypothetical protein GCM10023187_52560 [Nibrella viscosa]|uniref:Uncharacterized protein n=1 Tax=Nibrella viscosa TaxID=1084524 RepID=A0ABP8KYL7_9BACT